jgi:Family of unknown function (DUF6492)
MVNLSIVIVTWRQDFNFFRILVHSILEHNKDNIPVIVVCPDSDLNLFSTFSSAFRIIAEEDLVKESRAFRGFREGYITQQLVKLHSYKLDLSKNILIVDSDSKFIRDFYMRDFFDSSGNLLSVLTQDKDLIVDPHYRSFSDSRSPEIKRIYSLFEVDTQILRQVQMNPLISNLVLQDLVEVGFESFGINPVQALEISPFEYSWYTAWLLRTKQIPIIPIEPLFKTFHIRSQYINSLSYGISESDLSRAYIGVIYNSNWYTDYQKESRFQRALFDYRSDSYYFRHLKRIKRRIGKNH